MKQPLWKGRFRLLLGLVACGVLIGGGLYLLPESQGPARHRPAPAGADPAATPDTPAAAAPQTPGPSPEGNTADEAKTVRKKAGPFRLVSRARQAAPPTPKIRESFDKKTGALPAGWSRWSSDKSVTFAISSLKALSAPNSLAAAGGSRGSARAWPDKTLPADIQAGAAVYLDTLIPAQVFVRGSGADTASPTYYAATVSRGLEVRLERVVKGKATSLGTVKSAGYVSGKWVRLTLQASGKDLRVRVFRTDTSEYLDASGEWVADAASAIAVRDASISGAGLVGLARPARYNGTVFFDDFAAGPPSADDARAQGNKPAAVNIPALPRPAIPRHYSHIRIAMLAYYGNPMGALEQQLLKNSVDLVVPNGVYAKRIAAIAPRTPQLVYTNTSNLYQSLLIDWLTYADAKGLAREAAFFHAAKAVPFRGNSPSSQPVTWFWWVGRGRLALTELTDAAHAASGRVAFGAEDESLYLGYPERFFEVNVSLASGGGRGWSAALEYVNRVDAAGKPAGWKAVTARTNTTGGLARSGRVTFEPPADWKPAVLGRSARLHFVRFRTLRGGTIPVANNLLGRDYVGAKGTITGVIPAFDFKADRNKDGYLDDAEYARRAPGKDARFAYESRMLTESYGQMRFSANPCSAGFRAWAVDYHTRVSKQFPLASGFFMDNSDGKPPVAGSQVVERMSSYAADYGAMLGAISKAIGPRWVLANTGQEKRADPVVRYNPAYMDEFAIRPLAHHYVYFEDLAASVARRAKLASPPPLAVIDSHPQRGSPTDPRTQLATLAYYYLLHDPRSTFLMFFGGFEPASTWARHWAPAAAYDIGQPRGGWSLWKTGADPSNKALNYRIYQRSFEKALVLYKPLSYARGSRDVSSLGSETATKHDLGGKYRPLGADGTLGAAVTAVSLRNGEGAILIKGK
jgi:hypothetical protein